MFVVFFLASEWFDLELKPIKYEMAKEEPKERILNEQEIRRLIENSEAPLRHIILVALNTGMRKAEILNLEWVNVNLEHNFITTVTAQEAKNKKIRRIPINKSLRELFLKLNLTKNGNWNIFINILQKRTKNKIFPTASLQMSFTNPIGWGRRPL